MSVKPIIFSGPMVRALIDGRKTQTRRVLKPQPKNFGKDYERQWNAHAIPPGGSIPDHWSWWEGPSHGPSLYHTAKVPYAAGDLLWVREAWQAHGWASDCVTIRYRAQEKTAGFIAQVEQIAYPEGNKNTFKYVAPKGPNHWRPSIHMPRWASRLTLRVTDVRVQRVQEITNHDAVAEGIDRVNEPQEGFRDYSGSEPVVAMRPSFRTLWDSLNAPRGHGWDANPWVVALTFDVIRQNVNEVAA